MEDKGTIEVPRWLIEKLPDDHTPLSVWYMLQKGLSLREIGRLVGWSKTRVARFKSDAAQLPVRDTSGTVLGQLRDTRTPAKLDNGEIAGQLRDTFGTVVGQRDSRPPAKLDNGAGTGTPTKPQQKKRVLIYKNIIIIINTWEHWAVHARRFKRRPPKEPPKKAKTMIASCLKLVSQEELALVIDWYFESPERELPRTSGHTGWQTIFSPTKVEDRLDSARSWRDRGKPQPNQPTVRGEYQGMKQREVSDDLMDLFE